MDFVKLVESGKYKKEDLSPESLAYIRGMETALGEIRTAALNLYGVHLNDRHGQRKESLHEQMKYEIANEAASDIGYWLYRTICEAIVCISDDEAYEKEKRERDARKQERAAGIIG